MADSVVVWGVPGVDRRLPDGDVCPEGAVYAGGWTATYTKDGATANAYGSVGFSDPDPENYKPYDQLTEAEVLQWIFDVLGEDQVAAIEASLKSQVEQQLNPTHANGAPWKSELIVPENLVQ